MWNNCRGSNSIQRLRQIEGQCAREHSRRLTRMQAINNFPEEIMSGRPEINCRVNAGAIRTLLGTIALLTLFFVNSTANAQVLYGSITGTVADRTGAVIPGVTVRSPTKAPVQFAATPVSGWGVMSSRRAARDLHRICPGHGRTLAGLLRRTSISKSTARCAWNYPGSRGSFDRIMVNEAPPELQTETGEVNSRSPTRNSRQLPLTSTRGRQLSGTVHDHSRRGRCAGEELGCREPIARYVSVM